MTYKPYAVFTMEIWDAVLQRVRRSDSTMNHGFKSFELIGDGRHFEVAAMPLIRIVPGMDNISRIETNSRNHFLEADLMVFTHAPNRGEKDYRDHVRRAGAVYDVLSRRDGTGPIDPTLAGLVEEIEIAQAVPMLVRGAEGVTFVSSFPVRVLAVKHGE